MKTIDDLEKQYLGKSYYFLTVIAIIQDNDSFKLKCQCKCGNIHIIACKKFGITKSCGCYQKSDEYKSIRQEWNNQHKDKLIEKGKQYSQWCKDNPEKLKIRNENISKSWTSEKKAAFSNKCKDKYNDNPNIKTIISNKNKKWWEDNSNTEITAQIKSKHKESKLLSRINNLNNDFLDNLYKDDLEMILSGKFNISNTIRTKCPICGNYDYHTFNNVYHLQKQEYIPRLCNKCYKSYSSSQYENEIADYVKSFYNGKCIRNDRSLLNGKELDLYYPEKKIAIEFNGSYYHNDKCKSNKYHYNKFIDCYNLGITLVSIFDNDWELYKDKIIIYLNDLFNDKENSLSYINNNVINLNYPTPNLNLSNTSKVQEHYYIYRDNKVYTCGYIEK